MGWSLLDHTGDLGLEIDAPDPPLLFAEALRAFTDSLTTVEAVGAEIARRIDLSAAGLDLLLVDWLQEALFLFDTESLVFSIAEVELDPPDGAGTEVRLRSVVRGERFDPARHPLKAPIKAVTYHALAVTGDAAGWRARVVLDL